MSLTIYPTENYDSFVSIVDADKFISNYSTHSSLWLALTDSEKEIYLRIAKDDIELKVDTSLYSDTTVMCLPKSQSLMSIHNLAYSIDSEINKNLGRVTREKIDTIEIEYSHIDNKSYINTSKYPRGVKPCLRVLGAIFRSSQTTLGKS
jgi:hypothetical protein